MKKVLSVVLVVMMLAAIFAMSASAIVGPDYKNYGEVAIVSDDDVRLDAVKESAYNKAVPIPIKYVHVSGTTDRVGASPVADESKWNFGMLPGDEVPEGTATAEAYVIYDGKYLWMYVDVVDATLATAAPDALSSSYKQDSIEFMMDWGNNAANNDVNIHQARISHEGYVSARDGGPSGTSLFGSVDEGGPNPVTWLDCFAKHTDKGYACEMRITVPTDFAEENFSMAILLNDYDETGELASRKMITADNVRGSGQWGGNLYGYMKFDYLNYQPETGDTTLAFVAAAMVLALGVATVTVVRMKKKVTD